MKYGLVSRVLLFAYEDRIGETKLFKFEPNIMVSKLNKLSLWSILYIHYKLCHSKKCDVDIMPFAFIKGAV